MTIRAQNAKVRLMRGSEIVIMESVQREDGRCESFTEHDEPVMELLISSSIICTTDMKPKILGIPALGAIGYLGASVIVLYVFIKHIFSRK